MKIVRVSNDSRRAMVDVDGVLEQVDLTEREYLEYRLAREFKVELDDVETGKPLSVRRLRSLLKELTH